MSARKAAEADRPTLTSAPQPPAGGWVLQVAVDLPLHAGLSALLDYLSPQPWPPGTLVRVPLGQRTVTGVVWAAQPRAEEAEPGGPALKPVAEVMQALPALPSAWQQLVAFAARYYQRQLGEMALGVLPPELRKLDGVALARRLKRLDKAWADEAPSPDAPLPPVPEPSAEQAEALAQLDRVEPTGADARPVLLFGATGSGKTEVYLRQAQAALDQGRQVLMLVPEINLTPQLEGRLAQRFPRHRLVSLHSGLTPAQRLRHWIAALRGDAQIVLGTRLAVFTPLARPGLIVVDEEHDPSFKQQEGARYSARDLAIYRARLEGVPVLLGSATPSLESWQRAQEGRYLRLNMPSRMGGGAMPRVRVLDMNHQPKTSQEASALAPPLLAAIQERRARGEQSLLLLNRRGYAPVLHCGACAWKSQCPHCSAWRVFHKLDRTLRCHHCGFTDRVPKACPDCGNFDIAPVGRGTEKLEEQIAALLPEARVLRIDADSTRKKGSLDAQLQAVHLGEVDVLVGTQMVAKGHDFRRITLVAAVNPDGALFASDFRAGERLFALLLQAAGRAGRDAEVAERSELWLQTWNPQHALFAALKAHDYPAFAEQQLQERRLAGLPPFAQLALLRAEAKSAEQAQAFLEEASELAQRSLVERGWSDRVLVYPPVPPGVARVAGVERLQMLVESAHRPALQAFLSDWLPEITALKSRHKGVVRWAVDVDPLAI